MYIIKCENDKHISEGEYVLETWVLIAVDTVDELSIGGKKRKFSPGSIAWVINTGEIYGLNSNSEWVKQDNITLAI